MADSRFGLEVILGPPGTGKTTTVERLARAYAAAGLRVLVCSLTRAAAAEVAARGLPADQEVATLHAHAMHGLWRLALVDEDSLAAWNSQHPGLALRSDVLQRSANYVEDARQPRPGDAVFIEYLVLRARQVPRNRWPPHVARFAQRWAEFKHATEQHDFEDLIELALLHTAHAPEKPHVIIADEAQDHSTHEFALLQKWGRAAGQLVLVGDPWQALYEWRGAEPVMLQHLATTGHVEVLRQSHRVPVLVQRVALRWVAQLSDFRPIDYAPRPADGSVRFLAGVCYKAPDRLLPLIEQHVAAGQSVAVMASCGYMLRPTIRLLRAAGIPFANPWRATERRWNPLATRGEALDRVLAFCRPFKDVFGDIVAAQARGEPYDYARPWDSVRLGKWASLLCPVGIVRPQAVDALLWLAREYPPKTPEFAVFFEPDAAKFLGAVTRGEVPVRDAVRWLAAHLNRDSRRACEYPLRILETRPQELLCRPRVYVGTIHSFKGAQADAIIVFPDLSPAGARAWQHAGPLRDSVVRQFYVALTRAFEALYVCDQSSPAAVPLWRFVREH